MFRNFGKWPVIFFLVAAAWSYLSCGDLSNDIPCATENNCPQNQVCIANQCIYIDFGNIIGQIDPNLLNNTVSLGDANGVLTIPTFDHNTYTGNTNAACFANSSSAVATGYCFNPSDSNFNSCLLSLGQPDPACPGSSCSNDSNCQMGYACSPSKKCTLDSTSVQPITTPIYEGNTCKSTLQPSVVINFNPVPNFASVTVLQDGNTLGSQTCKNSWLAPSNCAHWVVVWGPNNGNYQLTVDALGYASQTVNVQTQMNDCQAATSYVVINLDP